MNILFLVHYFPPLNSTGARRILAFSKYLDRSGHSIHIISTVKTKNDGLLSEEVPEYCNLTEVSWFKRKRSSEKNNDEALVSLVGNRSSLGTILVKIKRWMMSYYGQLIDHRLLFAAYFLNPFLPKVLKKRISEADIIISSCPPWPVHLAGLICSIRFRKKWIADYRDQFSGNHVFIGNKLSQSLEILVEKWLLKHSSAVIVISEPMRDYYLRFNKNVFCIENGYDEEQFDEEERLLKGRLLDSQLLYIRYMGNITRYRVPEIFFSALSKIEKKIRENLRVEFYGESAPAKEVLHTKFPELSDNVAFMGIVSHKQSVRLMLEADALLFQETTSFFASTSHSSRGAMSAKLFEYLAAKKPIIAEVDPLNLMGQAVINSGLSCACTLDTQEMYESIMSWISARQVPEPNLEYISRFSRKTKTFEFEKIIIDILN